MDSLKAVAAMDGEHEGRVVKVVDYDAFGNLLSDSNPNLLLPHAFAGGLRDRFPSLVRFLHRDYDPIVGSSTLRRPPLPATVRHGISRRSPKFR